MQSLQSSTFSVAVIALATCAPLFAAPCENLIAQSSEKAKIVTAESVPAGASPVLPAFCRVAAILLPTSDSEIRMEIWLPLANWNGKLHASGNGGWSGAINPAALAAAVRRGYAAAMSDLGHEGGSARFALGHPEKLIDYGYRATHEMAVTAKAITAAFYGRPPRLSYFNGCSAGGRQGLMEAQRFPADFDGIVAGSPGLNWTGRAMLSMWIAQAAHKNEASYIPPSKYPLVHQAVLRACDARDGIKDGVLEDPTVCNFDPAEIKCADADGPKCLTRSQTETAQAIYSPPKDSRTNRIIFPALERGSELGWATMAGPQPFGTGLDLFKYVVFRDPAWDYRSFNFDADVTRTAEAENGILNAMNPNLKEYSARGGKLIQYHGWSDPQIAPRASVTYYEGVLEKLGGKKNVEDFYRLFMVPGMAHCGGGDGTSNFDMLDALENWVEHGRPPDQIVASRVSDTGIVDRTRPLCPYPQRAQWKGTGSTDEAQNFVCAVGNRR